MGTYHNPVHRGFNPDPSVIRVGDFFYMVNSSFQYFPAIPISRSKDLVNWECIGHAVSNSDYLDLSELADSHGIWAADISWEAGVFSVYATLRLNNGGEKLRQQILVRAEHPEGPWSRPIVLDYDNIDPSFFRDISGNPYMAISPAMTIVPLSKDGSALAGPGRQIWAGTGRRAPEGPHILLKDGWYYAILAEGGTGFGHCVTVARARELDGPWEESPYNPVLTQTDTDASIQRSGHGKLVQTAEGSWWMLYLCGRQNAGPYTTLGRETALDPVQWTEDGWFLVNEGKGPSSTQSCPYASTVQTLSLRFEDHFENKKLALDWLFVRNPAPHMFSLEAKKSHLRLFPQAWDLNTLAAQSMLLRRETSHLYKARLGFSAPEAAKSGMLCGLVCYYGLQNYARIVYVHSTEPELRVEENRNGEYTCLARCPAPQYAQLEFRIQVRAQKRDFYYLAEDKTEVLLGTVRNSEFLSDEGVLFGKHHTGTLLGFFAALGKKGDSVDFDYFTYEDINHETKS